VRKLTLPLWAFAALVAATVAAFFITQHLKVTTPLIAGAPFPAPGAINPYETACGGKDRKTFISFYLLHRSDDVGVYVVDQGGNVVRTIASSRHMRRGVRNPDGDFTWDGRQDDGAVAPDGTYYFRVALLHQGRTLDLTGTPVAVKTRPPSPVVSGVSPSLIPQGHTPVTIRYSGNERRGGTVKIYRTDLARGPRLVKSFLTPWSGQKAYWDGRIRGRPAPAGTYLVGLDVTDGACNTGHFPRTLPPAPGSTPHAGVTVRYLAAQPPPSAVPAGSKAVVYVDSRHRAYRWSLQRVGAPKPAATGASSRYVLRVPMPRARAGLYELQLRSGAHSTTVPVVAHSSHAARTLVVLPALSWQGLNPVDDNGDGLPNTLADGSQIDLNRPYAHGLPAGFDRAAALLSYLDASHTSYDLTTDLGLAAAQGPGLGGHKAVVLADSERWVPSALAGWLRAFVQGGGHVLTLGVDSLLREATVRAGQARDEAQPSSSDALGARRGALVKHSSDLMLVIRDGLGIFSRTPGAFSGFSSYQPITSVAAPAQILSKAGVSSTAPSIVGYKLGRGVVVDVALAGFSSALARNGDAQELLKSTWAVLAR
jgi:hypothetical protein